MNDNRALHIIRLLELQLRVQSNIYVVLQEIRGDVAQILVAVQQIVGISAASLTALNNIIVLLQNSNNDLANISQTLDDIYDELIIVKNDLDSLGQQTTEVYNKLVELLSVVQQLTNSSQTFFSEIRKREDDPFTNGDSGIQLLTVRQDTLAPSTSANGDYQSLKTNADGALYVTFPLGGGLATEANQLIQIAEAKHKKNRIKGSADYNSVITYIGATTDVSSILHTGTTDYGIETLTETFTYDGNNRITNIQYS